MEMLLEANEKGSLTNTVMTEASVFVLDRGRAVFGGFVHFDGRSLRCDHRTPSGDSASPQHKRQLDEIPCRGSW